MWQMEFQMLVKGTIQYVCGNKEGGDRAMKSASRTAAVIGGGIAGGLVGGPAGDVAGGLPNLQVF